MQNTIFFVTSLDSGGLENYLLRFLQEKHNEFSNIFVWCKSGKAGQLEKDFVRLNNVEIVTKSFGYINRKVLTELKSFIKDNNINAVCDFTGNFAGRVLKVAKQAGVPKRLSMYRGATDHFKKDILRNTYNNWAKRLTYKNATDILSNSKAALDYFYPKVWKKDHRFKVIYNGVNSGMFINETENLRAEFGIPNDAFVIGHTGRYNEAKNHKTIIAVAENLLKKHDDIYIILCGNGVRDNLHSYLVQKGLDNKIQVFENRTDIPAFLNTMDCYFFPSITEGQPNALIEAMIMGLPFVASDIKPIKESTPEVVHSRLVSPLNVNSFVDRIEEIYNNENLKEEFDFSEWARTNFNHKDRFQEFFNVINS